MSDTVLRTIDLTKRYKSRLAVDHLNIEVRRGEIFGFLGPNGAGKSTTIRMILHLAFPPRGTWRSSGLSLNRARHKALAKVGAVVEKPAFYGHLSALRNLEILGGLQRPVTRRRIMEELERVGLADRADDPVRTYSHGMNQRLGLALILLNEPELVILDEPTTGLDPQGMKEVRELIQALSRERGVTILLSSHLLYEVEMIATQMAIIHQGRLRVEGSVRDLLEKGPAEVLVKTDRPEELLRFLRTSRGLPVGVSPGRRRPGRARPGADPGTQPAAGRGRVRRARPRTPADAGDLFPQPDRGARAVSVGRWKTGGRRKA